MAAIACGSSLTPKNQPVSFFDYYEASHTPVRAPLAANVGYLEVEPGRPYTLSVYMKAQKLGTPACLAVREFLGGEFQKTVRVSPAWERYVLSFKPSGRWCYVLAGPDLRPTRQNPQPPGSATVWIDAVQLQQAAAAGPFATRQPLEIGIRTPKVGNVFGWDEPLRFDVTAGSSGEKAQRDVVIELTLTDFFDKEVWRGALPMQVAGRGCVERQVSLPPADKLRGFLRLHAKIGGGEAERTLRLAAIPISKREDSRFGINHAYSWPHLLDLCRQAGLGWVRDWSLRWQQVEPEKGRFTFAETDLQIDRPLQSGLRVLGLLPFPSSDWSSSAPASALAKIESDEAYSNHGALTRVAYAPRNVAEFESYVERTVAHYRGRIQWWQVFNESLCTHYSLPPSVGYKPVDYARLVQALARAARRADPQCRILAGTIGEVREAGTMDGFCRFFAAGALEAVDAVDIHEYPTVRRPEYMEDLLAKLNAKMDQCGGRKPIWVTECGYWADDDPSMRPMLRVEGVDLLPNEQMQAEFAVCWAAVLFAGGVDRIFYHAGTCCGINGDNPWDGFFKFDGQPHKLYAAQAVLSHLLGPTCRFVRRLAIGEGTRCYLFRDGLRLVAVVWRRPDSPERTIHLAGEKMSCRDLMGRSMEGQRSVALRAAPFYILADGLSDEEFAAALK